MTQLLVNHRSSSQLYQQSVMDDLLGGKMDSRLRKHIQDIDLQHFSRVPADRLRKTAMPNIGLVELVSADAFEDVYQSLYMSMFDENEREKPDLIIPRLADEFAGCRSGLAPYRIVGLRNQQGAAIGAAQFSVLVLSGTNYVIPYLQYIYVRPENRRQDMSEVLHTLVLAVAAADARVAGDDRVVPFTLFETEPPNYGLSDLSRANSTERTKIHTKSGSKTLMAVDESGRMCSCHVQPGLEPGDKPVTLIWATRPSPGFQPGPDFDLLGLGLGLIAAYYRSMRDEGFPEENIALAEKIAHGRCAGRRFVEIPLSDVTAEMYRNLEDESVQR